MTRSARARHDFGTAETGRWLAHAALALVLLAALCRPALALKPIVVDPELDRLEITTLGDLYEGRGDSIQLETAPSADGATGRMSVDAVTQGTNPNWIVFALTNPTDRAMERWLTADRYSVVGSGVVWPDLDARRIEGVTPSIGFVPERIPNERADVFRITLEPGQTITYVAELTSDRFARLHLWKPLEYELKVRDRQLFNGVMLGLTALLAIFLTAIFAANHKLIFPAAALVAWCSLGVLCVDFGFFHKLFQLKAEGNAVYRAATESALAASLVIFLYTFLRLALWTGLVRMLVGTWILAQLALIAIAVIDPRLASTFARLSFGLIGVVGFALTLFLALRGQDRALSLVPTWLLFCVWTFGASLVLVGRLPGDIAVSALVAGLVLILILIGFTVTQFAFRTLDPVLGASASELQTRSQAIDCTSAAVWEWSSRRDEVKVSPLIEQTLGLNAGELSARVDDFARHMHPADRERFRLMLWSMQERTTNKLRADLRLRHADNTYRWFEFEAASVPSSDGRTPKCVGLIRDVTESKRAHESLLHNAVHDSLTGLPNRELFLDRLHVAVERARSEPNIRPALFLIDIDKFKSVNNTFGIVVGDSLLLTAARRLQRHLGPQDTLARIGGDQFALLFPVEQQAQELASLAERIRRSLRSPVKIADQELVLTGSFGIAIYDGSSESRYDLLKDAEVAMYRAKRAGADRIEIFHPSMRGERDDRVAIESDLRKALEKGQLRVLYQPIVQLATEELAGFEALVRWEHPKLGTMNPSAFVPVAEESDLIVKLGSYVLARSAKDAAHWQRLLPRPDRPLFVSVNVSSRQLFRPELIQEIRHILGQNLIPRGSLHLEVTESLVMENPEHAVEVLEWLRTAGADVALDDFGTGYSSLAYLHRLPFDTIKIDRSLLRAQTSRDSGTGVTIVRSVVALAQELQKKVVAEGIETPEDAAFLRSIGCEYGQGFYYGEPLPDRDVEQLIKIIKKSERKMQPRGFFKAKSKKRAGAPGPADSGAPSEAPATGRAPMPSPMPAPSNVPPPSSMQPTGSAPGAGHPAAAMQAPAPPPSERAPSRPVDGPPMAMGAGMPPPIPEAGHHAARPRDGQAMNGHDTHAAANLTAPPPLPAMGHPDHSGAAGPPALSLVPGMAPPPLPASATIEPELAHDDPLPTFLTGASRAAEPARREAPLAAGPSPDAAAMSARPPTQLWTTQANPGDLSHGAAAPAPAGQGPAAVPPPMAPAGPTGSPADVPRPAPAPAVSHAARPPALERGPQPNGNGSVIRPLPKRPAVDPAIFNNPKLPPGIAASLARLAGAEVSAQAQGAATVRRTQPGPSGAAAGQGAPAATVAQGPDAALKKTQRT